MKNWVLFVAGAGGTAGVVAGALGAHALGLDPLSTAGHIYHLAVNYLLLHAIALLGIGAWQVLQPQRALPLTIAAVLFAAGMILIQRQSDHGGGDRLAGAESQRALGRIGLDRGLGRGRRRGRQDTRCCELSAGV